MRYTSTQLCQKVTDLPEGTIIELNHVPNEKYWEPIPDPNMGIHETLKNDIETEYHETWLILKDEAEAIKDLDEDSACSHADKQMLTIIREIKSLI